jgi:hypothetical protein
MAKIEDIDFQALQEFEFSLIRKTLEELINYSGIETVQKVLDELKESQIENTNRLKFPNLLGDLTIEELMALKAWKKVPSPKPTTKAKIIKAIENVLSF